MHYTAGENDDAILVGREALELAERLDLDDIRARALGAIGTARLGRGDAGGIADVERGIEIGLANNDPEAGIATNNVAYWFFQAGDVERARTFVEESGRLAVRFGDERMLRWERGLQPQYDYYGGRWDDALRKADAFIADSEGGSPHYLESTTRSMRALLRLARGESEQASADALRAEELGREAGDPQQLLTALAVRLRVEFELGRLERATELATDLLGQRAAIAVPPPAVELGWAVERLEIADAVREWIRGIAIPSAWNDVALAILDGELVRAAELFAEIGSLPDEARARLRAGDPENVRRALEFYRSVSATRYIQEGEALLAMTA